MKLKAAPPSTAEALAELTETVQRINHLETESLDVADSLYDRSRREQDSGTESV